MQTELCSRKREKPEHKVNVELVQFQDSSFPSSTSRFTYDDHLPDVLVCVGFVAERGHSHQGMPLAGPKASQRFPQQRDLVLPQWFSNDASVPIFGTFGGGQGSAWAP